MAAASAAAAVAAPKADEKDKSKPAASASVPFTVRAGKKEDAQTLLDLIKGLAVYEKEDVSSVVVTKEQLEVDGWGANPIFKVLIAEVSSSAGGATAVGFALYFTAYSTWTGRCIYLEDIFVDPKYRQSGIGLSLVRGIMSDAAATNCARVMWQVLSWNKLAFGFYDKIGASVMKDWVPVRMDRVAIDKFLASGMGK